MSLVDYQQQTRLLLNDITFARFNDFDLTTYINIARSKIAGQSECIRKQGTLTMAVETQEYPFSSVVLSAPGVSAPINVRTIKYAIAGGLRSILPRPWAWFDYYVLNDPAPVPNVPLTWSQYGQGAAGTLWFNSPDFTYVLTLDLTCLPSALTTAAAVEAIPYPWTDAIPYYAAWWALLTAEQTDAADRMYARYQLMMQLARQGVTPDILPNNYEQVSDPTLANKLASQPLRTGADIGSAAASAQPTPTGG